MKQPQNRTFIPNLVLHPEIWWVIKVNGIKIQTIPENTDWVLMPPPPQTSMHADEGTKTAIYVVLDAWNNTWNVHFITCCVLLACSLASLALCWASVAHNWFWVALRCNWSSLWVKLSTWSVMACALLKVGSSTVWIWTFQRRNQVPIELKCSPLVGWSGRGIVNTWNSMPYDETRSYQDQKNDRSVQS